MKWLKIGISEKHTQGKIAIRLRHEVFQEGYPVIVFELAGNPQLSHVKGIKTGRTYKHEAVRCNTPVLYTDCERKQQY